MNKRWEPGDHILLRDVWREKVWSARPVTVVHDQKDLVVLFMPKGVKWKMPVTLNGENLRLPGAGWRLVDARHPHDSMTLSTPGADHSVRLHWSSDHRELVEWYVNLEEPLRRSPHGFDFMDLVLDIVMSPDRLEWHWKDEDELEEAQQLGLISRERAGELRAEGERAVELIQSRKPPFDRDWECWRPDPSWPIPDLPEGWDVVT